MYSGDEFYGDEITSGIFAETPTEAEHHDGIWAPVEKEDEEDDEATGTDDDEPEDLEDTTPDEPDDN